MSRTCRELCVASTIPGDESYHILKLNGLDIYGNQAGLISRGLRSSRNLISHRHNWSHMLRLLTIRSFRTFSAPVSLLKHFGSPNDGSGPVYYIDEPFMVI